MKKQLILLIGNLAAGKTLALETVKPFLSADVFCFSIDDYRHKYQAHTPELEAAAWNAMFEDILKCDVAIVETSGTSRYLNLLTGYLVADTKTIKIDTPPQICLQRFNKRRGTAYVKPPLPFFKEPINAIKDICSLLMFSDADVVIDGGRDEKYVSNALRQSLADILT
jgi:predicted kinase